LYCIPLQTSQHAGALPATTNTSPTSRRRAVSSMYSSYTHFCWRLSKPQVLVWPEGLGKLKKKAFTLSGLEPAPSGLQHSTLILTLLTATHKPKVLRHFVPTAPQVRQGNGSGNYFHFCTRHEFMSRGHILPPPLSRPPHSPSPERTSGGERLRACRGFTQVCKGDDDVHAYGTLPIRESVVTPDVRVYHAPGDGAM
jgi:hypothetical protein